VQVPSQNSRDVKHTKMGLFKESIVFEEINAAKYLAAALT